MSTRQKIAIVAGAVLMLVGVGIAGVQESQAVDKKMEGETVKKQTVCPVMGGAVNTNLYVDYDGKRIYVCCKDCIETVKKDPVKYIRELEAAGVTLYKAQTTCPVMGGKIDKKVYADYDGKRIYFCCAGCIPQFKKDPGTYLKKLEGEGIAPESIPAVVDTEKKETPKAEHQHGGH